MTECSALLPEPAGRGQEGRPTVARTLIVLNTMSSVGLPLTFFMGQHHDGAVRTMMLAFLVVAAVAAPIGAWIAVTRGDHLIGKGAPRAGQILWWSSVMALVTWPLSIIDLVILFWL